jgi:hypothetical protein
MEFAELATLNSVGGIIALIVIAYTTVTRFLDKEDKKTDQKRAELISLLEREISTLKNWQKEADLKLISATEKITELTAQNSLLRQILQGKDDDSKDYRAKAISAIAKQDNILESINNLYRLIEQHLKIDEDVQKQRLEIEKKTLKSNSK